MMMTTTITATGMHAATETETGFMSGMTAAGAMIMAATADGGAVMAMAIGMTVACSGTADGGAAMATVIGTLATTVAGAISTTGVAIAIPVAMAIRAVAMAILVAPMEARATTEVTRTAWARPGETCPSANPLTPILAAARIAAPSTTA